MADDKTDAERAKTAIDQIRAIVDPATAKGLESAFYNKKAAIAQSIAKDGSPDLSPNNDRDGLAQTFIRGLIGDSPTSPLKLSDDKLAKLKEPLSVLGANIGLSSGEMDRIFQDLKTGAKTVSDSYANIGEKLVIKDGAQYSDGLSTLYNATAKLATVVEDGVALGLVNRGTVGSAKAIDSIKGSNVDPKIRDAVAEIASKTGMFGITIQESLEGEVNSQRALAEGRTEAAKAAMVNRMPIGEAIIVSGLMSPQNTLNLMSGVGIPSGAGIDDATLDRIRKPISDIVASQGLKPADVDRLLHDVQVGQQEMLDAQNARGSLKNTLWEEGNRIYGTAEATLSRAIKSSVDSAIGQGTSVNAAGAAPPTPVGAGAATVKKQERQ